MGGRGPKMGGFGYVWDVYGPGSAAGSGAASSRCRESWEDASITSSLKKPLYGLKTTEKRLKVLSKGLESRRQIIGD